jgi:hypothetical protein
MAKKENNNKNYSAHKAFIEHQRADRPKQVWIPKFTLDSLGTVMSKGSWVKV